MKLSTIRSTLLVSIFSLLVSCSDSNNVATKPDEINKNASEKENIMLLVSANWLNGHINDENLVILDTSVLVEVDESGYKTISGLEEYNKAHIQNARFADLKGKLSDISSGKDFVMPSPEQFQNAMRDLGVNQDSHVVIYSRDNQSWPTRIWWMLKWAGFNRASILNGGFEAWKENGFAISNQQVPFKKGNFEFKLKNGIVAVQEHVKNAIHNENIKIVDSLSPG
ncbi:MAG: sulfurtransferase, partial [Kangiellaceae bacterium]